MAVNVFIQCIILFLNTVAADLFKIKRSLEIQMPLCFSYFSQSHSRSGTQSPFPASRHLLNSKISTVTTTAWCHPTSIVAVTASNTAVCEHRLTPRGSAAAPPRSAPSARSGDRPCCLSCLFRYQARAFEQLGRSTTPIRLHWNPFHHSTEANHGSYYLTLEVCLWTRALRRFLSFKNRLSPGSSERRKTVSWIMRVFRDWYFFLKPVLGLLVLRYYLSRFFSSSHPCLVKRRLIRSSQKLTVEVFFDTCFWRSVKLWYLADLTLNIARGETPFIFVCSFSMTVLYGWMWIVFKLSLIRLGSK